MSPAAKLSYTVDEAAKAIGVSRSKIYEMRRNGEIETFTWCGRTLILAEVLQRAVLRAAGRAAA